MEEKTADEIAKIYSAAGHSVTVINTDADFAAYQTRNPKETRMTETGWKEMIQRNTEHLELIKNYKKLDETASIWTSEDFTAIDAAIVTGKKVYE